MSGILPRDENRVPAVGFESSTTPGLVISGKIDEATGRILTAGGAGAFDLTVEDGVTTVSNVDNITFSGATVTDDGAGAITVAVSGTGGGTVTSVSVVTANGLAGSVANATTTPAITLTTSVTGVVKGNGTALSAAVAGTDYVAPGAVTTSGLTMTTARILGRTTAATGAIEELTTVDSFVSAASDITAGKIEIATTAETNTGTDATRAVSPDGLAGSYAGTKSLSVQVTGGTEDVSVGDGVAYITIPQSLNGMDLIRAQSTVVTAGTTNATTVMIHNKTDAVDMLSGAISIASGGTVGTVGTIDTSNDSVATDDVIRIDVDSVSATAPKGLMVVLEFRLP